MTDTDVHTYVVAATKSWNRRIFDARTGALPGRWLLVTHEDELTFEFLAGVDPSFVFFWHWNWLVPDAILERYECVGFHLGDLPYGRGGSPLQNLIERGHRETMLSAFRLTQEFDAGPIYDKRPVSLEGGAEEIYIRAAGLAATMTAELAANPVTPEPQIGEAVVFKRRTPAQSAIPGLSDLAALHDFIRMLDAEGYPPAYLEHEGLRYEFRRSTLYEGRIEATVQIRMAPDPEDQSK